jgi:hypothetical protein
MELYILEGVVKALDSAPLVEALHELEGFAKSQNHEELARWASAEVNGYSERNRRVPEELPSYRKSFQIPVTEGIRDIEDDISKLQSISPLYIPNSNINQLKTRLVQTMAPSLAGDPFKRLDISKRLETLLQDIRSHAKRRLEIVCESSYQVDIRESRVTSLQQELHQNREKSMNYPSELNFKKEIYISYAWGGESEEFVNNLDRTLQEKGVTIIRDKRDLGYKGRIKTFMEQIGRGKCVIAVISDKYLKSDNCMFELVQVAKNQDFYDRIFPIVLADAQIYRSVTRIKYIQHWENEIQELDEALKGVGAANLQGFREDIDQYTEIRNTIAKLINLLKDMNTLTPDIHSQSDFEALLNAIEDRLNG